MAEHHVNSPMTGQIIEISVEVGPVSYTHLRAHET